MYSREDRVAYSEVDSQQKLTYFALVNYMQDTSCFHSDDVGFGVEYLAPLGLGWYVTSYEIHINRMPRYSERIKLSTYPYQMRGMMAKRIYTIESLDGEILAYANSQWILMNIAEVKPARMPDGMLEAYTDDVEIPAFEFEGDRLKLDGEMVKVGEFTVTENYIDTNYHMNNSFYIDITRKYLEEENFKTIRINYKKAALLNDTLEVKLIKSGSMCQVILTKDDEIYTIVEYK